MHLSGQKTAGDTLLWALSPLVSSAVTPKIAANLNNAPTAHLDPIQPVLIRFFFI